MFFSFDEGVLDLEDVGQAGSFFDGVEGLIDNFHVPLVVVDKFHFFLVVDDQLSQSLLQDGCGVVLDGTDLACFDPAASIESWIFEFFVEFG